MIPSEGDNDSQGPRIAGAIDGDLRSCWLCGKAVSGRAFFCHACGAVQPPHELDHFRRLGLERRFDLDLEQLERQRTGLIKALDPGRFTARGSRQREFSAQQADALNVAYEVLRDPGRRARYLLELEGVAPTTTEDTELLELGTELADAEDSTDCDRLGAKVAGQVADCVTGLSAAFRRNRLEEAAFTLARLEALEGIAAAIRDRRAELPPPLP
jgi:molecular chaperone HscB